MTSKLEERRAELEAKARLLASQIEEGLDDTTMGFALLVFDLGTKSTNMTWISNAQRPSMIHALKELLERFEHGGAKSSEHH